MGAFCFGLVIGWNIYYINRHRTDKVGVRDLTSLLGAVGGAATLALFPSEGQLFGWYSIGLAGGFFSYLAVMLVMVKRSKVFGIEFLLDGRASALTKSEKSTEQRPISGKALDGE